MSQPQESRSGRMIPPPPREFDTSGLPQLNLPPPGPRSKRRLVLSRGCYVALRCVACEWEAGRDFGTRDEMRRAAQGHLMESPDCARPLAYPDRGFEFAQGGALDIV